jgi:hypothetical protein
MTGINKRALFKKNQQKLQALFVATPNIMFKQFFNRKWVISQSERYSSSLSNGYLKTTRLVHGQKLWRGEGGYLFLPVAITGKSLACLFTGNSYW